MNRILITFKDDNPIDFALDFDGSVTIEQVVLVAERLKFLANYKWTEQETIREMKLAQEMQQKQVVTPEVLKPT